MIWSICSFSKLLHSVPFCNNLHKKVCNKKIIQPKLMLSKILLLKDMLRIVLACGNARFQPTILAKKNYGQLRKTALSLTPQAMYNQFKRSSAGSVSELYYIYRET